MGGACDCSAQVRAGIGIMQIGLSLISIVIGYACPYWADYYTTSGVGVKFGLWTMCVSGSCDSLTDPSDQMKAARAFGILSMLPATVAIVVTIVFLLRKNRTMLMAALFASWVTCVLCLIYLVLAAVEVKDTTSAEFGFCFGLTINAVIQAFFAGVTFYGAHCRAGSPMC